MLQLVIPDISHKTQWEEIMAEWDDGRKRPRIFFQDSYESFLEKIYAIKDKDDLLNQVPQSSLFFLQRTIDSKIVGFFCLRHNLTYREDCLYSGHIGYGIRPSERGKGYAKSGLEFILIEAKKIGLEKVLIACDDDNIASAKVIEANGGYFESHNYNNARVKRRRYWIDIFSNEREILKSLELELLSFDTRHNLDRIDELLADDFFECGKTGKMFGKKECLESLPDEKTKKLLARDIAVHMINDVTGQVRYVADIQGDGEELTRSFRTSLWRKTGNGWQMFFHQGTLIE